jgi:hypothetical protein
MKLALAPKVAAVAEDTAAVEADKAVAVVDTVGGGAVAEADKVAAAEDTAVTEADKVAVVEDTAVTEAGEGAADEDQMGAATSDRRHLTSIVMIVSIIALQAAQNRPEKAHCFFRRLSFPLISAKSQKINR